MAISVVPLSAGDLTHHLGEIIEIYRLAFDADQYTANRFGSRVLQESHTVPGFRFLTAMDGHQLAGFIYGYHLQLTNWWPALIRPAMIEARVDHWLNDTFELVEFAVDPARQQQGIGSLLYNALFTSVTEPRAMLGTEPPPTRAHRFYIERGWVELIPEWRHEPHDEEFLLVMGIDLVKPDKDSNSR